MRGIGAAAAAAAARRHAHLPSSYAAALSAFSGAGGGGGAGRGRGRGVTPFAPPRAPGSPIPDDDDGANPFAARPPVGQGRGEPVIPSSPTIPSFSSAGRGRGLPLRPPPPPPQSGEDAPKHVDSVPPPSRNVPSFSGAGRGEPVISPSPAAPPFSSFSGAGRGRGSPLPPPGAGDDAPRQPVFRRMDAVPPASDPEPPTPAASAFTEPPRSAPTTGAGRGVPQMKQQAEKAPEENRFIRRREEKKTASPAAPSAQPKLSPQDAMKRALEVLGRGGRGGDGGRGGGGRGGRGRGRGRGRGGRDPGELHDSAFLGDNADGEKLQKRLGEEKMKILDEAFDEAAETALPHPMEDALLDAVHTNNMIEFEPEYNVSFANPDIDEKPPMSLEEMLQKVKPFIVAYEGIKDQEEWEEIVKDVMKRAPHMKELIDMYSGPDVVTAKQQEGELQRVANTLPENMPSSVKRFTDRTLLSLKNNPGWGFRKKCQFMDKFAREVSEQYK